MASCSGVCQDPRISQVLVTEVALQIFFCPQEIDAKMLLREGFPSTQLQCGDLATWLFVSLFRPCHEIQQDQKREVEGVGPLVISICGT